MKGLLSRVQIVVDLESIREQVQIGVPVPVPSVAGQYFSSHEREFTRYKTETFSIWTSSVQKRSKTSS